ncbi:uncharacterized protein LOC132754598 [Ruditapes philippinarum]|uniref:uncharacterized protein LOC132754598 n=1 Tax=Ruditapes philippinarum TaxID=129788 RepID=UPI00295AF93C|nr:uncharacterized protein LOC132754598 [Ruditapes philippinarum]
MYMILLLYMLRIVCASVNLHLDNFEIVYSISAVNVCHNEIKRFQELFGYSIEHCVKACAARKHCLALNYRSRINICELFTTFDADQLTAGECILLSKEDIGVMKMPCLHGCNFGEVCEQNKYGHGMCVIKECVNGTVPEHGTILGNQMKVGKKIRYKCDTGYNEPNVSFTTVAECLDTGAWSFNTECLKTNYTWDSWTHWSTCSLSCGSGIQTRSRSCSIRIEGNDESQCHKTDVGDEQQACNDQNLS